MLKAVFENKRADLTAPTHEEAVRLEAEAFESNITVIACAMIERHLGLTYNAPVSGTYAYQSGSVIFRDHLQHYKSQLSESVSTGLAAKQSDAILSAGLPDHPQPWKELDGVPKPQLLDRYVRYMKERAEPKTDISGEICGQIKHEVRR